MVGTEEFQKKIRINCCKIQNKKIGLSFLYELLTKGDRKKKKQTTTKEWGEKKEMKNLRSGSVYWRKIDRSMLYMYFIYHINIFGKLPLRNCLQHEQISNNNMQFFLYRPYM